MAALTITDATLLSVGTSPERFDSDFRFGTKKTITVEIAKIDAANPVGVGSCADTADALRKTENWTSLTINDTTFGRAKLIDFSLQEGTWVTFTKATLTFEVYDEGDLSQLSGDYYKGLTKLKDNGQYLDDFSEDFSFQRGKDSTTYTYSLNLKFSAAAQLATNDPCVPGGASEGLACAREIINGGAGSRPSFALIDDEVKDLYSTYGKGKKRLLKESVDLINNTCTFTEEFTAYNITDATYSTVIRTNLTMGEDGIVLIKENGRLLGLDTKTDAEIERDMPEVDGEIAEAVAPGGRMPEMFDYYKLIWNCPDIHDLITDGAGDLLIIRKGRIFDTFRGESSYDITCTNDPKFKEFVIHEYTVQTEAIAGKKGNLYKAVEAGTITGKTKGEVELDTDEDGHVSWKKVKEYWNNILGDHGFVEPEGGGTPRIKDILDAAVVSPRLVSNNTVKSPWKVQITYNQSVSESPQFRENDGNAKSIQFRQNITYSTQKNKVGNVINAKKQILQRRETYGRQAVSASIQMVGKRYAELDDLLLIAQTKLEDNNSWPGGTRPQDDYTFISSCNYTFSDDNDIKLGVDVGWK